MSDSEIKEYYGCTEDNSSPILKVANGGAGPTGIIRAFTEAFLARHDLKIRVGWIQSVSFQSLEHLKLGTAHISLTYDPDLEHQVLEQGYGGNYQYIFKDHFILVGPKEGISLAPIEHPATKEQILQTFKAIADFGKSCATPVFITRDDGSGTHIKECGLWKDAGVALPSEVASMSSWYYRMSSSTPRFPADCLKLAQQLKCLTLVDRGTFLMDKQAQQNLIIYLHGSDDNNDILLNPCHALVTKSKDQLNTLANEFVNFMASEGQSIVKTFGKTSSTNLLGIPFYTPASGI